MSIYTTGYPSATVPLQDDLTSVNAVTTTAVTPLVLADATTYVNVLGAPLLSDGVSNWVQFRGSVSFTAGAAQPVRFYLSTTTAGAEVTTAFLSAASGILTSMQNTTWIPAAAAGQIVPIDVIGYFSTPPAVGTPIYLVANGTATTNTLSVFVWATAGGLTAAAAAPVSTRPALFIQRKGPTFKLPVA